MQRRESLRDRYPVLWLIVLIALMFAIGPTVLRMAANVLESPFVGCPVGYSSDYDRYEPTCVPD